MSEILTRDTSVEKSAARWGSVVSERKPNQELEKSDAPRMMHYVDTERSTSEDIYALCGHRLNRRGLYGIPVDCVVCSDLLKSVL
jgi:hypothetical protein